MSSVAQAEAAYKAAEEKAAKARQHVVALRFLTRGVNNSLYSKEMVERNIKKMFNAENAARKAKSTLRNTRLKNEPSNNHPVVILPHNNLWINYVEEEISPSRRKPARKTRRHKSRKI